MQPALKQRCEHSTPPAQLAKVIIVEVSSSAKETHSPVHGVAVVLVTLGAAVYKWHDA
jgi:hypothetical protein